MEQLETIFVFQQTQINIIFFADHSTVLLTFATVAFITVCYWSMTSYRTLSHGMATAAFFPHFFATSLFFFVGWPLELLATFLFAFIRLSANSYEISRSVFSSFSGILSCTLCLLYNIQPFTFGMSTDDD